MANTLAYFLKEEIIEDKVLKHFFKDELLLSLLQIQDQEESCPHR
jgi:hypothetical protein